MTSEWVLAILGIVFGATGFWTFLTKFLDKKSAKTKLLMGIAYYDIREMCLDYIKRGSITSDEYADLKKYHYQPYHDLGGDGVCERLMAEVDRLPIKEDE